MANKTAKDAKESKSKNKSSIKSDKPKEKTLDSKVKSAGFAIVKSGGKQYLARVGDTLTLEKIDAKEGENIKLPEVLFFFSGSNAIVGTPNVKEKSVEAKVVSHGRGDKIRIFKMKSKKRYRKSQGHRQSYTKVLIEKI